MMAPELLVPRMVQDLNLLTTSSHALIVRKFRGIYNRYYMYVGVTSCTGSGGRYCGMIWPFMCGQI